MIDSCYIKNSCYICGVMGVHCGRPFELRHGYLSLDSLASEPRQGASAPFLFRDIINKDTIITPYNHKYLFYSDVNELVSWLVLCRIHLRNFFNPLTLSSNFSIEKKLGS